MKKIAAAILTVILSIGFSYPSQAEEFSTWIDGLIKEAIRHGVRPQTAYNALSVVDFDESVIQKDVKQPENTITAPEYWKKIVTSQRIQRAKRETRWRHPGPRRTTASGGDDHVNVTQIAYCTRGANILVMLASLGSASGY